MKPAILFAPRRAYDMVERWHEKAMALMIRVHDCSLSGTQVSREHIRLSMRVIRMKRSRPAISKAGYLLQWLIQVGVCIVGKPVRLSDVPWLDGPLGEDLIGPTFYARFAAQTGLLLADNTSDAGLLADFDSLAGAHFDPARVHPEVRRFYEHTAQYDMDVWSQWHGVLTPFARLLVALVSPLMEQFNLPLAPLATSKGVRSDLATFVDGHGRPLYAGWLRQNQATGAVIYAGFYTVCTPPGAGQPCVKVMFPVPKGSTTVILRPQNGRDGTLILISHGSGFGTPGFYRIHRPRRGRAVRVASFPLHEVFHVYSAEEGTLRTDHTLHFLGLKFLTLHYHIRRR